jgi:hypothetical protein
MEPLKPAKINISGQAGWKAPQRQPLPPKDWILATKNLISASFLFKNHRNFSVVG